MTDGPGPDNGDLTRRTNKGRFIGYIIQLHPRGKRSELGQFAPGTGLQRERNGTLALQAVHGLTHLAPAFAVLYGDANVLPTIRPDWFGDAGNFLRWHALPISLAGRAAGGGARG